jgi:protein involved in polysaccharide export with SLBB domain
MTESTDLSISELRKNRGAAELSSDQTNTSSNGSGNGGNGSHYTSNSSRASTQQRPLTTRPAMQSRAIQRGSSLEFDAEPQAEGAMNLPFDPMRLVEAVMRNLWLCALVGMVLGGAMFAFLSMRPHTMASIDLIRRDAPVLFRGTEGSESYKPVVYLDATILNLVKSPEVVRRISARTPMELGKTIPASQLGVELWANQTPQSDLITLGYKGGENITNASKLTYMYADEAVKYLKEMQAREGSEMASYISRKLEVVERDLAENEKELAAIPPELRTLDADKQLEVLLTKKTEYDTQYAMAEIDVRAANPLQEKLQAEKDALIALQAKYTDENPLVQDQIAKIQAMEKQMDLQKAGPTPKGFDGKTALGNYAPSKALLMKLEQIDKLRQENQKKIEALSHNNVSYVIVKNRHSALEQMRTMLMQRQREAQIYAQDAMGYYQILPKTERASGKADFKKGLIFSIAAAIFGIFLTAGLVAAREVFDPTIKSVADLERITGLPVLATLGDLTKMSEEEKKRWAFRTWTILKGKITETQTHSMVCGLISAKHGEGRTTWTQLLAQTAFQRGLRVLVAATKPSVEPAMHPHEKTSEDSKAATTNALIPGAPSVLAFPFQAARQLSDPKTHSIVHIPLPGWVWNLERRQQWQSALAEWQNIDNLVFLVELPPASEPEAVLLSENIPQLIWMCQSGKTTASEVRSHLETLRHAGCNLVGAVLNHEPNSFVRRQFSRFTALIIFGLALLQFAVPANAQNSNPPNTTQAQPAKAGTTNVLAHPVNVTDSVVTASQVYTNAPAPRSKWQQKLTLGPGDVLNLGFYGETNLTKFDVVVGMDGRISYLQAQGVMAAGLTVDELRDRLNEQLKRFFRTPRVIVSPVAFHSKKYYVLGKVGQRGVYTLDKPITILEAVSRARGLETGILERNAVDLADLQHSFLIRDGKRLNIDFERLFFGGDFSQNAYLEPDDFLYFPPANLQEVYVVGEVRVPGLVPYTPNLSVMKAISDRGGFNDQAWRHHILVVRGSLSHPQTFIVNSWAKIDAREQDFKLKSRDIIYVAKRPWYRAEELADTAAIAFLQSAVASWAGANIGPIIGKPFVPSL